MADAHKNFASSLVATAPSPATSGTSLSVTSGEGALFPAVPFNATVCPANTQPTAANAEIIRVTARTTDALTIARTQEGSTARTIVVGDQIFAGVTAKTLNEAETGRSMVLPTAAFYQNIDRRTCATTFTLISGTVYLFAIELPYNILVSNITFVNGGIALGTGTHQFFGLYDASRNLLATSADATSAAWAASTAKTLAMTTPYSTTASGIYYGGILVSGTTMPTPIVCVGSAPTNALPPISGGSSSTAQTSLPNPAAAITAISQTIYFYVS